MLTACHKVEVDYICTLNHGEVAQLVRAQDS